MDCRTFEDLLNDYIEGNLEAHTRVECGLHRLNCSACRSLYDEIRILIADLRALPISAPAVSEEELTRTVLRATSAGEMLSCDNLDHLIERYFDGEPTAPSNEAFEEHFAVCHQCRRLMAGIEEAVTLCHELGQAEVDLPESLPARILAATSGGTSDGPRGGLSTDQPAARLIDTRRLAVGLLLLASVSTAALSHHAPGLIC